MAESLKKIFVIGFHKNAGTTLHHLFLKKLEYLGVPNIFIGRAKISDKASYYTTYEAYNKITTYAYHHNHKGLVELAKKYGYGCLFSGDRNQCNIIFQKNQ